MAYKLTARNKEKSDEIQGKSAAIDYQTYLSVNESISNGSQNSSDSPTRPSQSSVSDVAWDWHSPRANQNKKNHQKSGDVLHTPKGSRFKRKKRNLNSPPIFKPNKRKLLKKDDTAKSTYLEEELQALSNQLQPDDKQSHEFIEKSVIANLNQSSTNEMTVNKNETTNKNESQRELSSNKNSEYGFDEDDSIDECLIRCSQEIEEKLNLNAKQAKVPENPQLLLTSTSVDKSISKCVTPQSFSRSKSSQIERNHSEVIQQPIILGSKSTEKKSFQTSMTCHANVKPTSDVKKTNIQSTNILERKNSTSKVDYLDNEILKDFLNESQDFPQLLEMNKKATEKVKSGSNKFFKNTSDSNFDYRSGSKINSVVVKKNDVTIMKKNSSSSSRISKPGQSVSNENLTVSHDKKKINNGISLNNEKISNSDSLKVNEGGSSKKSSVTQCTQEEIESKRRAAIMKLEAKKRVSKYSNQQKVN